MQSRRPTGSRHRGLLVSGAHLQGVSRCPLGDVSAQAAIGSTERAARETTNTVAPETAQKVSKDMGWDISLSASKLSVLNDCEACFWLANSGGKVERPRGIFPSLPGGMDRVLKSYVDQYRGSLPPELAGQLQGHLWGSVEEINRLRNWRSGLKAVVTVGSLRVSVIGALDDLLFDGSAYTPLDWKTRGDAPKEDGSRYYGHQVNIYALLLQENGMTPSGEAILSYHWPQSIGTTGIQFGNQLFRLPATAEAAMELLERAVSILAGPRPGPNAKCEYCRYAESRRVA